MQNIPQLPRTTPNAPRIQEYLWNHELKCKEKQGSGFLALLTWLCKTQLHSFMQPLKKELFKVIDFLHLLLCFLSI